MGGAQGSNEPDQIILSYTVAFASFFSVQLSPQISVECGSGRTIRYGRALLLQGNACVATLDKDRPEKIQSAHKGQINFISKKQNPL